MNRVAALLAAAVLLVALVAVESSTIDSSAPSSSSSSSSASTSASSAVPPAAAAGFLRRTVTLLYNNIAPTVANLTESIHDSIQSGDALSWAVERAWYLLLGTVGVIVGAILIFRSLFMPFILIRRMEEIGYIQETRRTSEKLAMDTKLRRKRGDLPPPYPNGWYRLCDSRELKAGDVKSVDCLGEHFVVFRGENGRSAVLDAYCPHLGANLGIGGKVKDNCIECPFHGWAFNEDGKCVKIPYAAKIPDVAKTRKWISLETNSHILVWFDAEGREPTWYPPDLTELNTGKWTFRGSTEHNINAHIQEVPENGADVAHLTHVHSPIMASGRDLRDTRTPEGPRFQALGQHIWEASWKPGEGIDKHIGFLELVHKLSIFGITFAPLNFYVSALQVGPALVYLKWKSVFGQGVFVQAITPVGPMEQNLVHAVFAEWKVPTFFAKFVMLGEALQVERDIMIWNNKCYNKQPVLVQEDSLIGKWRRWYSQFYSESSKKLDEGETGKLLDW